MKNTSILKNFLNKNKLNVFIIFSIIICNSTILKGQESQKLSDMKFVASFGLFQGGSLVGIDIERQIKDNFGAQLGCGFIGYSAGLNYHFKPNLKTSFISLLYIHQGIGNTYTQSVLGPVYVYRGKKWFTASIGIGYRLDTGPALPKILINTDVMLMYSIGGYFLF